MKVTVDVDCSPAEARAFLGLPDVTPIHDKYIKTMLEGFEGVGSAEQMESSHVLSFLRLAGCPRFSRWAL